MSRPKERIIPFLEFTKERIEEICKDVWNISNEKDFNIIDSNDNLEKIENFWLENPDLRFSQVLVGLGIIPNIPGFWYYIEEDEILEKLGIPTREYLLWGQNYDKDMNLLPKTLYKPIKDLSTDHIQAILEGGYAKREKYIKCFKEELKLRNGNTDN